MQYGDEKREKLNQLEKKLYSRNAPDIIDAGRSELSPSFGEEDLMNPKNSQGWQDQKNGNFDELVANVSKMTQKKHSFVNKIFVFSILFFLVAAGVATFVFLGGMNTISSKNVDIKIVGPLSVGGGQEVSLDINVINNNNTDLDSASLLIKYPTGTRSINDLTKELDQERFALDKIKTGESFNQNIKVVFFGEKESVKQLKISIEYRVANSSALFYKDKVHEITISSAPIIITPTYPKEINSNQEVTFDVEVASNSKDKLENFLVNVEYPFGFVFKEAVPKASYGDNVWRFSSLNSGDKKTISIKGSIIGQDNEEKVFKINTGTASVDDDRTIAIAFSQSMESILVKKPFIGLDVNIENQDGDFTTQGGSQVVTKLNIRNNLPSRLFNTSVEVSLSGGALNQASVAVNDGGFFQSFNNTILWDKRGVAEFSDMEPGFNKTLSFRLVPLLYTNIAKGVKPEITMTVTTRGERILESGSVEKVSSIETRKIILATEVGLSAKVVRAIGNIENSGPVPPKSDIPTTYTVIWSINNSFNQVSNVEVRAIIPSYIKWTNLKSPSNEIFTFNPVTNEMVWTVGSLLPNVGFDSPKKEIYFQLEFLPSASQIGQAPNILGETRLSGIDKVTGLKIESKAQAVTTNFSGDPSFKMGDDKVVR